MKKLFSSLLAVTLILSACSVFTLTTSAETVLNNHTTLSYTKSQIIEKFNAAKPSQIYSSSSLYETKPSTTAPYSEGTLADSLKNDTLKQVNFYRWLAGENTVTLNTSFIQNNQKGALTMAVNNVLTHHPSQPAGMSDSFYADACKGTSAGIGYSGNVAFGLTVNTSILGYINDTENVSHGVGHRFSLLDKNAIATSFGQVSDYSCLSMHTGTNSNSDSFYSWPSAGYFPNECISSNAKWSTALNTGYTWNTTPTVTLTYNGKDYTATDVTIDDNYNAIFYTIPTTLSNATAQNGKFIENTKIAVKISGVKTSSGAAASISYTTEFFNCDESEYDPYTIILTDKNGNSTTSNSITGAVGDTFKIEFSFNDTTISSQLAVSMNPAAFGFDTSTFTVTLLKTGNYPLTFIVKNNESLNKVINFTVLEKGAVIPTTQKQTQSTTQKPTQTPPDGVVYGDVNSDGKINAIDLLALKKYITGMPNITINKTNTDCNKDGKYNALDLLLIKKHIVNIPVAPWN